MEASNRNYAFVVPLVRALAGLGVHHAVVSPGSRNTPLALALAEEPAITDWSVLDERSAGFFARGLAAVERSPVILACTSGTAAAGYLPAVVEARLSRVPLIVITADRPPELADVGAPQTIDQVKLYGGHVKWFLDAGVPDADGELARHAGSLAARLWSEATDAPMGPVHLNVRFRDPLVPAGVAGDVTVDPVTPRVARPRATHLDLPAAVGMALDGARVLVVAGPEPDPALPAVIDRVAAAHGWPVVADPLSGLRTGSHPSCVAHGDLLARAGLLDRHRPEVVLRLGRLPTSKPLWGWLEAHPEVTQVVIDPSGWSEPLAAASAVVRADPAAVLEGIEAAPSPADWAGAWESADTAAAAALDAALEDESWPSGPAVARTVFRRAPAGARLWLGSSLPVREVDSFGGRRDTPLRVFGNRGANGIDGLLSAAAGSAAAGGGPVVALAGDLSVLHDVSALATIARLGLDVTVVAVNNDGGGIFHYLDQPAYPHFEKHFATPHGLALAPIAAAFGMPGGEAAGPAGLVEALSGGGPRLVEVRTDRSAAVAVQDRLVAAVAAAVG